MQLPTFIVAYAAALLSAPWRFTLTYLSLITATSHDFLTRGLQQKYSFKKMLQVLVETKLLTGGYLIIDETDVDKSFAARIACLGWIFSHRKNKHIYGLHLVVVAWTNDTITIPLAWKIYNKTNGKTKLDLAIELIDYCLFTLRITPKAWLFDAFYASEKLLKHLIKRHQVFYSQVPKTRLFNNSPLRKMHNGRPYWQETGVIKGGIEVQVVKNRKKYYVTNSIGISRRKQLDTYRLRWRIEEVFRFVKKELGFEKCQSSSLQGQNTHFGVCFLLYAQLQDIAEKTQMTDYCIKQKATLEKNFMKQLVLPTYLSSA